MKRIEEIFLIVKLKKKAKNTAEKSSKCAALDSTTAFHASEGTNDAKGVEAHDLSENPTTTHQSKKSTIPSTASNGASTDEEI